MKTAVSNTTPQLLRPQRSPGKISSISIHTFSCCTERVPRLIEHMPKPAVYFL